MKDEMTNEKDVDEVEEDETEFKEEISKQNLVDIRERTFLFAVRIVKLCRFLEQNSNVSKSLIGQLLDAGTSVGANLRASLKSI